MASSSAPGKRLNDVRRRASPPAERATHRRPGGSRGDRPVSTRAVPGVTRSRSSPSAGAWRRRPARCCVGLHRVRFPSRRQLGDAPIRNGFHSTRMSRAAASSQKAPKCSVSVSMSRAPRSNAPATRTDVRPVAEAMSKRWAAVKLKRSRIHGIGLFQARQGPSWRLRKITEGDANSGMHER
jgi:hypothetical protein